MMEQQSLLTDVEFNPVLASTGKRFLNYLIDLIVYDTIKYILRMGFAYGSSTVYADNDYAVLWFNVFLSITGWLLLYFLSELIFKGRTIGKFVTGTKAVNEDGTEMSAKTTLLRTLCRIIPFEPLRIFWGRPWHDKWTKTYVIDVAKTGLNDKFTQA